jgi:proteasome assembly chaperone (PAC2) family protein
MWFDFEKSRVRKLRNPTLVVAVSTSIPQYRALYSQARELGEYMLKKMEFEKVASVRSSAFPPEVFVRDEGVSRLPECSFYLTKGRTELVLFTGDTSPMDEQYEFAKLVLGYAKELGVKELFSIGARWAENPLSPEVEPEPSGFATDKVGVAKLKKNKVHVLGAEPAPFFASMVVAMAKDYGIRGYKISVDHGEPSPHVRSVAKLLGVLADMTGIEIPLDDLKAQTKVAPTARQPGDSTIYH